jgi:XRE family transcriptional regulator, regulator of sulfur utilization
MERWRHSCLGEGMSGIQAVRKTIGENIRRARRRAGLTQEQLAERADLHPVYISQVERGIKAVSVEALWKFSKPLRVSTSTFLRGV